jgi:hypothetical protein
MGFAPPYDAFVGSGNNSKSSHPCIEITLVPSPDPPSPVEDQRKIFDNGESWSLFKDRQYYCIVLHSSVPEKPFCVAWASHDFRSATVFYGESRITEKDGRPTAANPFSYPLDQIFLMHILAWHQGAIIHAAGMDFQGHGYLFPGKSGAGKSTVSRLFASVSDLEVLSDDRMVVRKMDGGYTAYGTPWPGDAGHAVNKGVPLRGLLFVQHATENRIERLTPAQALERLLPVMSIPWYDQQLVLRMLAFCDDLVRQVPAYDLHFKPDAGVIDHLRQHLARVHP